jgi:DNA invertase Pin-like site-specific DNA recombinase
VYTRLSVEDSGRKGADTIETQIELVTAYVSERSYLSLTDTYIDNGSSGKDFDRPAWNRLMDDIRAGRVDCVCVKDLSRFGRNYIETCEFLEKIFPFMGVRFLSVNDGYDSEHEEGHEGLIIALKNLINDNHIRDISRKVGSSIKTRRERGEFTGSFAPFGYKKSVSEKGRLAPDEETAPIVRQIFTWRAEGASQREICQRLDDAGVLPPAGRLRKEYNVKGDGYYKATVWQPRAIRKMITNRVYLGHLAQGKTRQALCEHKPLAFVPQSEWHISENAHEPIISLELWEAANAVEAERRKKYFEDVERPALPDNLFKGFLVCGACGSKLVRRHSLKTNPSGKSYEYISYHCNIQRQHPEDKKFPMVRFETIYGTVFPMAEQRLRLAADLGAIIEKRAKRQVDPRAAIDAEISRAVRELESVSQRLAGLYENYADRLLSEREYVAVKGEYERRAESLRLRTEELSRRAAIVADVSASGNRWLTAARAFQNPETLTREMLEAMVESIVVSGPEKIEVTWKFKDEFALLESVAGEEAAS